MSARSILIGICGGIGAGKSVVSAMLRAMGYDVYDCDRRARAIMDESMAIKQAIARDIAADAITPAGGIDRARLASAVFADDALLANLNSLVHSAVSDDLACWHDAAGPGLRFVETALPRTSGLWHQVDAVWMVTAPVDVRIRRVMARSGLTAAQVEARMAAQQGELTLPCPVDEIVNDGISPVLPRLQQLLAALGR